MRKSGIWNEVLVRRDQDRIRINVGGSSLGSSQKVSLRVETRLAGPAYRFGPTHTLPGLKNAFGGPMELVLAGGLYPTGGALSNASLHVAQWSRFRRRDIGIEEFKIDEIVPFESFKKGGRKATILKFVTNVYSRG